MIAAAVTTAQRSPIAVIAVGNALLGDDGFGPATLRLLETGWQWPPTIELIDVGTGGLDLVHQLLGRDRVILLDAAAGAIPGSLVELDHARLLAARPAIGGCTPHEPSIVDALRVAQLTGQLPRDVSLVGVVPLAMELGVELSSPVREACARAAARVVHRCTEWGEAITSLDGARDDRWWAGVPIPGAAMAPATR